MSQGSTTVSNQSDTAITAKTDTITLGALTFTLTWDDVTEAMDAGSAYNADTNPYKPTWNGSDAFQGTDLTNANGVSKYWTGEEAVPYDALKKVGVAKVVVTATLTAGGSASDLAAALVSLYGSDANHQFTITVTPEGQLTVAKSAGDASDGLFIGEGAGKRTSALALETPISWTEDLSDDGSVSSWNETFYYATRVKNDSDSDSGQHAGDLLNGAISGIDGAA